MIDDLDSLQLKILRIKGEIYQNNCGHFMEYLISNIESLTYKIFNYYHNELEKNKIQKLRNRELKEIINFYLSGAKHKEFMFLDELEEIQRLLNSLERDTVDFPLKPIGFETPCIVKLAPVKHKIVELKQTSSGCPNQWEGKFEDGDYCYIRAKRSFSINKSDTKDRMGLDEYDIFECDMPEKMSFWYDMTTQELITLCKELNAPVEFELKHTWGLIKL